MALPAEIRDKAIRRMGRLSYGQTPPAAMTADLDEAYLEVYAQLDALDLATWDEDEEVPPEFVHPVVALTAYQRLDEYAVSNDRRQRILLDAASAVPMIKTYQASNVYDQPTAEYY